MLTVEASIPYNPIMQETFVEQLRRLMRDCGETRYSLSQKTGIDQSALSRFANGSRGLSMQAINRVFEVLDLEIKRRGQRRAK
jgi:transcriptional regulator with XRE-family HTH domain